MSENEQKQSRAWKTLKKIIIKYLILVRERDAFARWMKGLTLWDVKEWIRAFFFSSKQIKTAFIWENRGGDRKLQKKRIQSSLHSTLSWSVHATFHPLPPPCRHPPKNCFGTQLNWEMSSIFLPFTLCRCLFELWRESLRTEKIRRAPKKNEKDIEKKIPPRPHPSMRRWSERAPSSRGFPSLRTLFYDFSLSLSLF